MNHSTSESRRSRCLSLSLYEGARVETLSKPPPEQPALGASPLALAR